MLLYNVMQNILMYHIHQKIKDIRLLDGFPNIFLLQGPSLVQLGVVPTSDAEIEDEEFTRLAEQYGRFGGNHADVFVTLHNAFDAGQWQVVVILKVLFGLIGGQILNVPKALLPKLIQGLVEHGEKLG